MSKHKRGRPKRRDRGEGTSIGRNPTRGLRDRLDQARELIEWGRLAQAREILEEADHLHPRRAEVLMALTSVYHELGDKRSLQSACERLLALAPDDPNVVLRLAWAYASNERPALAARTFRKFLARWDRDPRAGKVRSDLPGLESILAGWMQAQGISGPDAEEIACLHEEIRNRLDEGEWERACQVAEELLRRRPAYTPALNNMGEALFRLGRMEAAVDAAKRALAVDPDNVHSLANLTRYLYLGVRQEEARQTAERLKALRAERGDRWVKVAEALATLGDDQGILDALADAERSPHFARSDPDNALLYHLAAVAAMRLGREAEAREHWKRALELDPKFEFAKENLGDLKKPVGERHAPWFYESNYWLPEKTFRAFAVPMLTGKKSDAAVAAEIRRGLEQHPLVANLIPLLLDRGDPRSRQLALGVSKLAATPPMLAALREFAFGQRGPDEMRYQAAMALNTAHALPPGPVRLWIEGEWRKLLLMAFEIHEEHKSIHGPKVEELGSRAMNALHRGSGRMAERFLKKALELEPEAVDLLNNLAAAYDLQGRDDEVQRLTDEMYRRNPDYFFSRIRMAMRHIRQGNLEEAKGMMEPLFSRQRLHRTEFLALAGAQIEYCLAKKEYESGTQWLRMLEEIDPDDPALGPLRRRLERTRPLGRRH
jgi:tetratricopeptide (TPR) repeat protein